MRTLCWKGGLLAAFTVLLAGQFAKGDDKKQQRDSKPRIGVQIGPQGNIQIGPRSIPSPQQQRGPTHDHDRNLNRNQDDDRRFFDRRPDSDRRSDQDRRFESDRRFDRDRSHQHDSHHHDHSHSTEDVIIQGLIRGFIGSPYGSGYYRSGGYRDPYYSGPRGYQPGYVGPSYSTPVYPAPTGANAQPSVAPPALVVPTEEQFAGIPDAAQRDILLHALNSLESDLASMSTAESWKKHLQLATVQSLLTEREELSPAARERLLRVADSYARLQADQKYRQVTEMWGFGTLRVGLPVYAAEPEIRLRRQLIGATQALSQGLDGIATGSGWKKHLRLEDIQKLGAEAPENREERAKMIEDTAARFDSVADNGTYKSIAEKPGFAEARDMLHRYAAELREPADKREASSDKKPADVEPPAEETAPSKPREKDAPLPP